MFASLYQAPAWDEIALEVLAQSEGGVSIGVGHAAPTLSWRELVPTALLSKPGDTGKKGDLPSAVARSCEASFDLEPLAPASR